MGNSSMIVGDRASAQQQDKNDERNRDSDEPEKNGHGVLLQSCELALIAGMPGAVTKAATFGRRQARAKSADQQRCRQPESQLRGSLSGRIDVRFCLRNNLVDAFVGVGLTETRSRGNDLRHIVAVSRLQFGAVAEARDEQTTGFAARLVGITLLGGRCVRTQQGIYVAIHWSA